MTPNLLAAAVSNGIEDLRTGDLRAPSSDDDYCVVTCPEQRRRLISLLRAEERAAQDNQYREDCLMQPMAGLVQGSYGCKLLADGTEVFEGNGLTVTIPPSCVKWAPGRQEELRPKGPTEMDASRRQLLFLLQKQERDAPKANEKDEATIEALIKSLNI